MPTPTSVRTNRTVPVGAGILRKQLLRDGEGRVFLTTDYYFQGQQGQVTQLVNAETQVPNNGVVVDLRRLQKARK